MRAVLFLSTCLALVLSAASGQTAAVDIPLSVSDGTTTSVLRFGLDSTATNGLDASLGENELPPLPPSEAFDTRFLISGSGVPPNNGSLKDYRQGGPSTNGTIIHRIRFQCGLNSPGITISWSLPAHVTGRLQDPGGTVIDVPMNGSGSRFIDNTTIINQFIDQLKMTITYAFRLPTQIIPQTVPRDANLFQNYPNPFNPTTTIVFGLPVASHARLAIHDIQGNKIMDLADNRYEAGVHQIQVNARNLASGTYFCRIDAGTFVAVKKLMVLK